MNGEDPRLASSVPAPPEQGIVSHGVLSPLASAPGGVGAAVLHEADGGAYSDPAEQAWLTDGELAQEAAFIAVGSRLLAGGGVMRDGAGHAERMGRNLFTEAEHATNAARARDLLEQGGRRERGGSADEIAQIEASDPGVSYLRENADALIGDIAGKQAKAAQDLLDTYDEVSRLRPDPDEIGAELADDPVGQARWLTGARSSVEGAVSLLPEDIAKPLRKKLGGLAEGDDPARWFVRASELSDELQRARAKAARLEPDPDAPSPADALQDAKALLDRGLADEALWGRAARAEGQRAAGYARRYGDHLQAFENAFSTEVDGRRRTLPEAFRAALDGSADPEALRALGDTIESARATADVAAQYGRKDEAARIRRAISTFERTGAQARAIGAARDSGSRETADAVASALEWLTGGPSSAVDASAARVANRSAVFRAAQGMTQALSAGNRSGVQSLLSTPLEPEDGAGDGPILQPPAAPAVTAENYDATRDHIDRMATDPAYFAETMAASFGALPEAAPEVYSALAAQTAKVSQYLAAVAPGGKGGGPFAERVPVGEDDLWEFNERFRASTEPEFIRNELAAGRLSSQAAEAYELMHPRAYAALQRDVFERLYELGEQGIPVPIQAREQIDLLLNIDGGGDPALTWQVAERAYAAMARKDALQPSAGTTDGVETDAMTSGALATLGNGATAIAQTG